jgi:hypothetical protein
MNALRKRRWKVLSPDKAPPLAVDGFDQLSFSGEGQRMAQSVDVGAKRIAVWNVLAPDFSFEDGALHGQR